MKNFVLFLIVTALPYHMNSQVDFKELEILPESILDSMEEREKVREELPTELEELISSGVVEKSKIWNEGVLKVSFKGGSPYLHRIIAQTANIWTDYGDITFDFGYNPVNQTFRSWKANDSSHIRVGFGYKGYWSLVGNTSVDWKLIPNGQISLNLAEFDSGELPSDYEAIILHEFGHSLGFKHEHQSPDGDCDFKWDTIYKELAKEPNKWSKKRVDRNLRKLQERGLTYTKYDIKSIMHYSLPSWMFESGEDSECYTSKNLTLSKLDQRMMGKVYPKDKEEFIAQRREIADTYSKAATLIEPNETTVIFNEKADYFSKVREENSKYIVGIQGLRVSEEVYANFSNFVINQGYSINLNSNHVDDKSWLSKKSVVLYYNRKNRNKAKQIAAVLSNQTGQKFEVGLGRGLAVFNPAKQFYVHFIPEN